ncbi:hypothetical protein [Bacillus sp. T33-2]|uniref:hypothetical protein n=1 Tax=Bacillus sp. T33-2 TaxID=2054168 RepID=UPI000C756477|nr:hypothetical protein [Bacillus sp. T33-2]PLR98228.1 hypothetical protein CVD19_06435 [Bacillus sp. T33-2]
MANISDKQLLDRLGEFQKHGLSFEQKNRIIVSLRKARTKKKYGWKPMLPAAAAMLALLLVPVLFFSQLDQNQGGTGEQIRQGAKGSGPGHNYAEPGIKATPAERFTLHDKEHPESSLDVVGIPGKIAVMDPFEWVAEDKRNTAKMLVFAWGEEKKLLKNPLKIEATHVDTGITKLLAHAQLGSKRYGSDAHAVTSFQPIPKSGTWILSFSFAKEKFAEFSVHVKEPYVNTAVSTLLISQEDLHPGTFEDIYLDVQQTGLPEQIEVKWWNSDNPIKEQTYIFKKESEFADSTLYKGGFSVDAPGTWRMTVLGESTAVDIFD